MSVDCWEYAVCAHDVASSEIKIGGVAIDNGEIYWLEGNPGKNGAISLFRMSRDGTKEDLLPTNFSVRSLANGYGGGGTLVYGGRIWFCNHEDQRIYEVLPNKNVIPKTPQGQYKYADLSFDKKRNRILAVRESRDVKSSRIINEIVFIDLNNGIIQIAVSGDDFYSNPVISPDGSKVAWLSWNHPDMPWTKTNLRLAELTDKGMLEKNVTIGEDTEESLFQPSWSPRNELFVISDRSGWWNIYKIENNNLRCIFPLKAEFGKPMWQFGTRTYGFIDASVIACIFCVRGAWNLALVDLKSGELKILDEKYTSFIDLKCDSQQVVFSAGSPRDCYSICLHDLAQSKTQVLRCGSKFNLGQDLISTPKHIEFDTTDGESAFGLYYSPAKPRQSCAPDQPPPLLVFVHGGPTLSANIAFDLRTQFWTTRGYAILDVNYRGSTGYGRDYRLSLAKRWGIKDVDDCIAGAKYLMSKGLVDDRRVAIRGFSAGGFTVMKALMESDIFAAGTIYYGVTDIRNLGRVTHNFESHYLDWLVSPEMLMDSTTGFKNKMERIRSPLLFFHGLKDRIVPSSQTKTILAKMERLGLEAKAHFFESEGHGFRDPANIEFALIHEHAHYQKVFERSTC